MMNCERIREQIPEALAGRLSKEARETLVEHLETCGACRTEVAELNAVWRGLEAVKTDLDAGSQPDNNARARFQEMLAAYQAGMEAAPPGVPKSNVLRFPSRPVWQAAIAAGLLACGIFFGRLLPTPGGNAEMAQLRTQVENLNQMVALSMLQGQSPVARMRGVTYSERIAQPDPQVLDALLQAVNHDSSVNVRLSAVDALQKFGGDSEVARAMVNSIPGQDSPLVQIALIDMLVQLNARVTAPELARMANDSAIDQMVRQRMQWAVNKLEMK